MIEKFKHFIQSNNLCHPTDRIMLAVSGGRDSVAMADLFQRAGYDCIILHCNFGLRDTESEGDEAFVRSLAGRYDYPVFVERFETESYAKENGISIQMAARDLRYSWFEKIAAEMEVERIATAHNLNDSVETALLNLTRGTGVKGITGIPVFNGKYIRPLLGFTRREIDHYCSTFRIGYREDSSNTSRKYQRNQVRHDMIPVMESLNPSFIETMNENMQRFGEVYEIFQKHVKEVRDQVFMEKETFTEVNLEQLRKLEPLSTWLYEFFSPYGFSMEQCRSIGQILDSDSGKQFISPSFRLFKDRERLLLFGAEDKGFDRYYIDSPESRATLPFAMDMEVIDRDTLEDFPDSEQTAVLDLDVLNFPLTVRKWQHGDYFYPLGMEQMKKVSDFFIDQKVPVPLKNRTWLLTSGNKIVWIIGMRIDNRFRITDKTRRVLKLQLYKDRDLA